MSVSQAERVKDAQAETRRDGWRRSRDGSVRDNVLDLAGHPAAAAWTRGSFGAPGYGHNRKHPGLVRKAARFVMRNAWAMSICLVVMWLSAVVALNAEHRPTQPPQWEAYQSRAADKHR
jgi:hypothetical protein